MANRYTSMSSRRALRVTMGLTLAASLCACSGEDPAPFDAGGDTPATEAYRADRAALSQAMVTLHNATRDEVTTQPPLENVVWDDDLADVAQAWADRCEFVHSDNDARSEAYGQGVYVGENLSINSMMNDDVPASALYQGWDAEGADYDYESNSCAPDEVCGHYTQIVWRDSTTIGCGATRCDEIEVMGQAWSGWFLVCNYAPGGNYLGEQPY